jgi:hypothetical protein
MSSWLPYKPHRLEYRLDTPPTLFSPPPVPIKKTVIPPSLPPARYLKNALHHSTAPQNTSDTISAAAPTYPADIPTPTVVPQVPQPPKPVLKQKPTIKNLVVDDPSKLVIRGEIDNISVDDTSKLIIKGDIQYISINQSDLHVNNAELTKSLCVQYCLNKYDITTFSKKGKYAAVLLESRYNDDMPLLLKQISRFLTSDWSVILLVSENVYKEYLLLVDEINSSIQVKILDYKLTNVKDYNNILLNITFWNKFSDFEKVLIFQADTMIYKYGIDKFLKYDYVGAPWPESLNTLTSVGNGGFSLRDTRATNDCILNINHIVVPNYSQYKVNEEKLGGQPEDIVFSHGMKQLGYSIPDKNIAKFFSVETVDFNTNCIGSHQLNRFNKELSKTLLYNSIIPYSIQNCPDITGHRFGWNYVTGELKNKFINENGVPINTWLDCDYLFNNKNSISTKDSWIGITHLTPVYFNNYFKICNINNLIHNKAFINDLKTCKGLFTLSNYMKVYLKHMLCILGYPNIPVDNLYHPVSYVEPMFNPNNINKIRTVVSVGTQLRKNTTIFKLKTAFDKIWLPGREANVAFEMLEAECQDCQILLTETDKKSVKILNLNNIDYDNLLVNSHVIIDVYEASANNALIECISRDIPCFASNIPAICEYIGDDYPLLFNNLQDLEEKLTNTSLIHSAHKYLIERPYLKERLTIDNFIKDILNSEITKNVLTVQL